MPIITLSTDFGAGSPHVAAMKGVIFSIDPAAIIVDISHTIPLLDITRGAQVLDEATPWFPADTIHVAVVDPGVGAGRPILYARVGSQQYIAPDNGLLRQLMAGTPPSMVLRLTEQEFWLPKFSRKYLGRDIMAPVAVRLSLGLNPRQLGPVAKQINEPRNEKVCGEIMAIDSFGNLITNILLHHLAGRPLDSRACIACGIYETFGIYETYGGHTPGALVALVGSSGRLELAVVGDNAAERTGVTIGMPVTVGWNGNNRD
jgi:S-adenosylmethionine hydrolase